GGALGITLLLESWFGLSPAYTGFVFNALCYLFGIRMFGAAFIVYSFVSAGSFSVAYRIAESFPPLFPFLADMPLIAAFAGAAFVGVSIGICVRAGGAPTGDDALAMSLSKLFKVGIQWVYLISDLTVLALSVSYLPIENVLCSLVTVVLSGQIIALFQKKEQKA
ncbi:MAG: YitT family protein, partial [Clostridia bacterium]|nr:YitT family protein [Clostridia bacterium]